ncbi:NAD(P)H-hydrate dehydratase [Candidatus Peregrinibacteria bacterium]|nr:NAD(P)H-hydrate dehydratase [Candidatus Peregrinibacteria bacterium]
MIKEIRTKDAKKLLVGRRDNSHKGDNGRVLIIGGSVDFYGAPVLAGLGALYSGADLVYLYVPECNFECTRSMYPDFIVRKYPGEYLTERYTEQIIEFGKTCDSVLIGPGLSEEEKTKDAVLEILKKLHVPTVLDAEAISVLKKMSKFPLQQPIVITPHGNEFKNLVDREIYIKKEDTKSIILLRSISMDLHINVLLKGSVDYIASDEGVVEINTSGNSGMTVGGSGDVLSGVTASMIARGADPYDAAKAAAHFTGLSGDNLKKKKGNNFSASDIAFNLPYVL